MTRLIKRICCVLVVVAMGVVFTGCSSVKEWMGSKDGVTVNIDDTDDTNELDDSYEFYLTKEELLDDIESGYIFRMDKTFHESATPTVIHSNWPFYVNEDNIMNLEIEGSNLSTEIVQDNLLFDPIVEVNVVTPEGNIIYTFVKQGEEIIDDFSVKEQIALYHGEWNFNISFFYYSEAERPSNLKISAVYENPSKEDITWLKDNRL